jgi:hypothetical protein
MLAIPMRFMAFRMRQVLTPWRICGAVEVFGRVEWREGCVTMYNINSRTVGRLHAPTPHTRRVPMMSHRILPAALLLCTLAACGDLPTQQGTQAQPAGASYDDGGFGVGSGNSATQSSGYGIGSGNEVEGGGFTIGSGNVGIEDSGLGYGSGHTQDTAAGDSTGRGGFGVGSGN